MTLWLAYTLLASGLMALGIAVIGSALEASARLPGPLLRVVIAAGFLVALVGAVAVSFLEGRAVQPW
jgi:hypothetical protein